MTEPLRVLQVSAEIFPLLKTGGLADVTGALPAALAAVGCAVRPLLPAFPALRAGLADVRAVGTFTLPWGEPLTVLAGALPAVASGGDAPLPAYLADAPALFDRAGDPYADAQRRPYADNHRRFAALGWAAAHLAAGLDAQWRPQLVHGHDWHAGLTPACMRLGPLQAARHVPYVHTIHNLAYQGLFESRLFAELGLPPQAMQMDGMEFFGQMSFMKAGIFYADRITTVSPTYAREIQTPEQGHGLDGLLRARRDHLSGILNGIDPAVWNPATDRELARPFSADKPEGKSRCKAALQAEMGLMQTADAPLFAVVSRLTEQKGLHLVLAALDTLLEGGGQLVLLGSGDPDLEQAFGRAALAHPGRVAVKLGYDESLAHRIFGGSDVTLVPSRFEPCGLTQMYGLRYGSLPLVRAVGGLADTVVDTDFASLEDGTATGFVFAPFTEAAYRHALRRALALWRRPRDWAQVRGHAMRQRLDWSRAAQSYADLYAQTLRS